MGSGSEAPGDPMAAEDKRAVLDTLLARSPVASAVVDARGCVVHHNAAIRRIGARGAGAAVRSAERGGVSDATPDAVATDPDGLRLADLVPAEVDEAVAPLIAQVARTGTAADPVEVRVGEPGRRRYWQVDAFPLRPGGGGRAVTGLLFVEITDDTLGRRRQRESLARLDLALEAGGLGTWDWDLMTGRVMWSAGMETIAGLPPGTIEESGGDVLDMVPPAERSGVRQRLVDAARSGADHHDEFRIERPGGEQRWVETRGRVVATRDGIPLRMIGVASDVTERHVMEEVKLRLLEREHQARLAAEASRERLSLLVEVSGVLAATLDPRVVHQELATLLVPRMADWCVLDSLDDEEGQREAAVVHVDPGLTPLVREARSRRRQAGGDGLWSVRRAMRTGRSERVEHITDDDLASAAADDDHLALLRALGPRSAIVAPLVARGRVLGGITLVTTGTRPYDADDHALVEDIAARAATAIDTAMLFASRTQVARALQQSLLPPALPEIPGVDLGARYRVAEAGIEIGGDFYDVFETDGGWVIVLGDVCGKGPVAAAVTGLLRHTLRAVAPAMAEPAGPPSPAAILSATNDAILDQLDDSRFATAALVTLVPGRGRAALTVACGGHPLPVLLRADGTVERVEASGTLLGVLPDPALQEVSLELGPGDALVLYTDGVTESRNGPTQFGEARLMRALRGAWRLSSAVEIADVVVRAVDDFRDPRSASDDIAVIAIRVPGQHDER